MFPVYMTVYACLSLTPQILLQLLENTCSELFIDKVYVLERVEGGLPYNILVTRTWVYTTLYRVSFITF